MMGVQPINEGIFKKSGKFKDIIKSLFKTKSADEVLTQVSPYEVKYGHSNGTCQVEGYTLTNQGEKSVIDYNQDFLDITVITDDPLPLPNDPNKKSTKQSFSVYFLIKNKDNTQTMSDSYFYFKSIYYIDGKETDKLGLIKINGNQTCISGTLSNYPGDCVFPQDIREKILKTFEKHPNINDVKTWLDKIK